MVIPRSAITDEYFPHTSTFCGNEVDVHSDITYKLSLIPFSYIRTQFFMFDGRSEFALDSILLNA